MLTYIFQKKYSQVTYAHVCGFHTRHGLVFWELGKPVAHISICFSCEQISSEPRIKDINNNAIPDFKNIFNKMGFPTKLEEYKDYYYKFHPRPKGTKTSDSKDSL